MNKPGSIRTIFDAATPPLATTADPSTSHSHSFNVNNYSMPQPMQGFSKQPTAKQSAQEDELVRRIHRKVGGPAKLSTYNEPARVRRVVIEALATEQRSPGDASRVRRGQLSALERRVIRTVTNRGAAVRSRMRQRKEMAELRMQIRDRDARVRQLEAVVRALCSAYSVPLPPSVNPESSSNESQGNIDAERAALQFVCDTNYSPMPQSLSSQSHQNAQHNPAPLHGVAGARAPVHNENVNSSNVSNGNVVVGMHGEHHEPSTVRQEHCTNTGSTNSTEVTTSYVHSNSTHSGHASDYKGGLYSLNRV